MLPFKVSSHNVDLFLNPDSTSGAYDNNNSVFGNIDSNLPENIKKITGWVYFNLNIHLDLDIYKNSEVVKRLKNLDNNWDFYLKKLGKLFDIFIRQFKDHPEDSPMNFALSPVHRPAFKDSQKQLAQKPVFKKPQKQLTLNFKEWLEINENVKNIIEDIKKDYPEIEIDAYENKYKIEIIKIKIPKHQRKQGIGSSVIKKIQDYARSIEKPIVITPEAEKGYENKLNNFYKKLGFVDNKGKNIDFTLSSPIAKTMYWK